jgi:hypothetical protein
VSINPREHPFWLDVLAEFGLFAAGGLFGYAATLLAPQTTYAPGCAILGASIFMGGMCAAIKKATNRVRL